MVQCDDDGDGVLLVFFFVFSLLDAFFVVDQQRRGKQEMRPGGSRQTTQTPAILIESLAKVSSIAAAPPTA